MYSDVINSYGCAIAIIELSASCYPLRLSANNMRHFHVP